MGGGSSSPDSTREDDTTEQMDDRADDLPDFEEFERGDGPDLEDLRSETTAAAEESSADDGADSGDSASERDAAAGGAAGEAASRTGGVGGGAGEAAADEGDDAVDEDVERVTGGFDDPEEFSDILHESDEVDVEELAEAETPEEFARAVFPESALADRFHDGEDGMKTTPVEDPGDGRLGGWGAFDPDEVVAQQPLKEALDETGARDESQVLATLGAGDDAERAVVTRYNADESLTLAVKSNLHRELSTWAATDSFGLAIPEHTADIEQNWIAKRYVEGTIVANVDENPAVADRVDRAALKYQMAGQLLAGNNDLHIGNWSIGPGGRPQCIDVDQGGQELKGTEDTKAMANWATNTADYLDKHRADDNQLNITDEEVTHCCQVVATAAVESGHYDRLVSATAEYDMAFGDNRITTFSDTFKGNLETLSQTDPRDVP